MQQSRSRYTSSRGGGQTRLTERQKRVRRFRNWLVVLLLAGLAFAGFSLLNRAGTTTEISAVQLPCYADQDVTPFGSDVAFYDGTSIQCYTTGGSYRWSVPVGSNASFSVNGSNMIAWTDTQVFIINNNGRTTYNESMTSSIQFCRIGQKYAAVVIGSDTQPDLLVKDLQGSQQDEESEGFKGMLLLDVGFYGSEGQYMWTLALDVYNTAINTELNTFEVAKMNTGKVSLGEKLAYKVLYQNNKLLVFTTQQMYTFDYKAVQDTNASKLVYGWKVIDVKVPDRGEASILLAPTAQAGSGTSISNLRYLNGTTDSRFNLRESCVGAFLNGSSVYAVSGTTLYRSSTSIQQFYAYQLPLPEGIQATNYLGLTNDGHILVAADSAVYAITLPN